MTEKQAKKVFLKQASPFLRRYEREQKRRNVKHRATVDFKTSIHARSEAIETPFFEASFYDVIRGSVSRSVPILFALPVGFEQGFRFTCASEFESFKKYCEGK